MKRFHLLTAVTVLSLAVITLGSCSKQDKSVSANQPAETIEGRNGVQANRTNGVKQMSSLEDKLKQSVLNTFGADMAAEITEITSKPFPQGSIYTYEYTTETGAKSSFVVIENVVEKVKITIDCTGTCDCRERVILDPNTGLPSSYECTCNQCKMTLVQE